ncbi:HMG-Y-related protein A-like [Bidens hawaiensis]|uniref:HMG-Y-related protein A-like n=1 Tax=Bidens hawaiensis TaxID=980011 RepID=UPI00404AE057
MADEQPSYSQMIFAAIDAKQQSESLISSHIESTHGSVPDDLSDQLKKLVDNGELVVSDNSYYRPESSAPAKRGRGRPPKAKEPGVLGSPVQTGGSDPVQPGSDVKRGRGRPKKDPNAPPAAKKVKAAGVKTTSSKTGRPRGRPRKVQADDVGVEAN